jgi:hypothetical protein
MLTLALSIFALALNAWASDAELMHRAYLWVDGKPLKTAEGKAAPLAVWGLTAPIFVESAQRPTPENPISIRFDLAEADRLDQLAASKKPFLIEFQVLEAKEGRLVIRRVVRLHGTKIEAYFKVMPGHGREGGLANRPYVALNLSAQSVEAGPPDRVKPTGG